MWWCWSTGKGAVSLGAAELPECAAASARAFMDLFKDFVSVPSRSRLDLGSLAWIAESIARPSSRSGTGTWLMCSALTTYRRKLLPSAQYTS